MPEADSQRFEILLVEDNPADVELVRLALSAHCVNCSLHMRDDGAEAMNWIDELDANPQKPALSLVLLDMHLPKHSGEDILKCLRATANYSQTPVILMTSLDSDVARQRTGPQAQLTYFKKASTLHEFMQLGAVVRAVLGCPEGSHATAQVS